MPGGYILGMTNKDKVQFTDKGPKPTNGRFFGFDHLTFYVGNAKQAASYYATRLGLEPVAYKGLETGSRNHAGHVLRQNEITLVFISAYKPNDTDISSYLARNGDEVKDVAFAVDNLENIVNSAEARGAKIIKNIWEESDDDGTVRFAKIQTFGENTHTLIDRSKYKGIFLPGYVPCGSDTLCKKLPPTNFDYIDHVVGCQPDKCMESIAQWYEHVLQFHRFWSVDDKDIQTKYSSLRSTIMSNWEENIKITIAEPAIGIRKSQVEEFVEYHGGPGVQHIAFHTENLVDCVINLKERGMEFLEVPDTYYDILKENLKTCSVEIQEDLKVLQELKILVDYDENGYLLQIFTKNMQDRPTLFIELIQRRNHDGFGAANFRALFEAIEKEQARRGNLL